MELRLCLVVLFAWTLSGCCKPLNDRITAARNNTNVNTTATTTTTTQPEFQSPKLDVTTTRIPLTEQTINLNSTPIGKKQDEPVPWSKEKVPILTFVGAVSVLAVIVVVLFVIVAVDRIKRLNSTASEDKQQEIPMKDVENNLISSRAPDSLSEPESPIKESVRESLKEPVTEPKKEPVKQPVKELEKPARKIDSLKYDQPYAHQKQYKDIMKNMLRTESEPESLNDILLREPGYYTMCTPRSASDTKINASSATMATPFTEYVPMNGNYSESTATSEYQVPRNAKKRAGLLQRDPSSIKRPGTLKDDNDYLVLMSDKPIIQDKKLKTSKSPSVKKGTSKKFKASTKAIPKNSAQSRIKFFQEQMKSTNKELHTEKTGGD